MNECSSVTVVRFNCRRNFATMKNRDEMTRSVTTLLIKFRFEIIPARLIGIFQIYRQYRRARARFARN